jgi:hypothetical protein
MMENLLVEVNIYRPLIHISSTIIPAMLQSYSTCPEYRAMLRSNPSAEAGTKTEEGGFCCPLFIFFGIGIKARNPRGLGTESSDQIIHTKQQKTTISYKLIDFTA